MHIALQWNSHYHIKGRAAYQKQLIVNNSVLNPKTSQNNYKAGMTENHPHLVFFQNSNFRQPAKHSTSEQFRDKRKSKGLIEENWIQN